MTDSGRVAVVAGILCDTAGRVLIAERRGDGPFAGLWEFPGGKRHATEAATAGLARELREELGIDMLAAEPFMHVEHDYPDRQVAIEFFIVTHWRGEARGLDGQALRWVRPDALEAAELLPADAPLVAALQQGIRARSPG